MGDDDSFNSASQEQQSDELFSFVYWDMRRLAQSLMSKERRAHTLQPTALVHEAFLRLADSGGLRYWQDQGRFQAIASRVMQHILIEHARGRNTQKRGGQWQRVDFPEGELPLQGGQDHIQALHDALDKLNELDARKAHIVRLRYFAGLTIPVIAARLKISPSVAAKEWSFARSWLQVELQDITPQ